MLEFNFKYLDSWMLEQAPHSTLKIVPRFLNSVFRIILMRIRIRGSTSGISYPFDTSLQVVPHKTHFSCITKLFFMIRCFFLKNCNLLRRRKIVCFRTPFVRISPWKTVLSVWFQLISIMHRSVLYCTMYILTYYIMCTYCHPKLIGRNRIIIYYD